MEGEVRAEGWWEEDEEEKEGESRGEGPKVMRQVHVDWPCKYRDIICLYLN